MPEPTDQPLPNAAHQQAVDAPPTPAGGPAAFTLAVATLWRREMVRFFRQRNRVIGAMATPLLFWLLLGSGLDRTFTVPLADTAVETATRVPVDPATSIGYLEYFYPGTVVLVLLFTAIFSTITVIEDRREGFLQAVLVAPVPRSAIALGKVVGGASIATIQGVVFLALWPIIGAWPGAGFAIGAVALMFVLAVGLTALGLCLAWPMDSTAGFHAVMNLLLMPMWFLSGAVFPLTTAPLWMRAVMYINPLTYGHAAFAGLLTGENVAVAGSIPWPWASLITVVFAVTAVMLATKIVARRR